MHGYSEAKKTNSSVAKNIAAATHTWSTREPDGTSTRFFKTKKGQQSEHINSISNIRNTTIDYRDKWFNCCLAQSFSKEKLWCKFLILT